MFAWSGDLPPNPIVHTSQLNILPKTSSSGFTHFPSAPSMCSPQLGGNRHPLRPFLRCGRFPLLFPAIYTISSSSLATSSALNPFFLPSSAYWSIPQHVALPHGRQEPHRARPPCSAMLFFHTPLRQPPPPTVSVPLAWISLELIVPLPFNGQQHNLIGSNIKQAPKASTPSLPNSLLLLD